jgi:hypothetical protein
MPALSCQEKLRRLRLGIEPEGFLTACVQEVLNGFLEVGKTFLLCPALAVGAGNFETSRPKTAFIGFAPVNNGCELFHGDILALVVAEEKEFVSPVALAAAGGSRANHGLVVARPEAAAA